MVYSHDYHANELKTYISQNNQPPNAQTNRKIRVPKSESTIPCSCRDVLCQILQL